jgi:hypothetical protein
MNKNLMLIIGGCGVLLVVCCMMTVVVVVVAGGSIQDQVAAIFNQTQGQLTQGTDTTTPGELPTVVAPGGNPAPTKPSSGSTSGNPFLDALTKAKAANKYRVEFSMVFGGTENGTYKEAPFVAFSGEIDGTNSHIISSGGLLSSMMTGSETGKVEIIDAGATEYMKGASSLMGVIKLDPNTWYIANDKTASSFADFAKPDEFSSWTGSSNLSDFKKVRSESVDGQGCDVYLYDMKSLKNAALTGLLGSSQSKSDFDSIDRADINLWLCGDGYVHKYILDYEGHSSKDATQKGALKMNWHVWDVNSPTINIQAPAGAKPMPTQ